MRAKAATLLTTNSRKQSSPVIRIFLASPSDVWEERGISHQVIDTLGKEPHFRHRVLLDIIAWDDPSAGVPMLATERPQESIERARPTSATCDIVVVILWTRMGTPLSSADRCPSTGEPYESGTEREFEEAVNSEKFPPPEVLVYRRRQPIEAALGSEAMREMSSVEQFFKKFREPNGAYVRSVNEYDGPEDFRRLLRQHLDELIDDLITTDLIRKQRRRLLWNLGALTVLVATAIVFHRKSVDQAQRKALVPAVRVESRETIMDLSEWKETSKINPLEWRDRSLAISRNIFSVVRTNDVPIFVHIIGTSSGIEPDVTCKTHPHQVVARPTDSSNRWPSEWEIWFDISDVPINKETKIQFEVTFWNAFQESSQWWAGFRILHDTNVAKYTVIFPPRKHPNSSDLLYSYFDGNDHPLDVAPDVKTIADVEGRVERATWHVPNPVGNRSYRIKWNWDRESSETHRCENDLDLCRSTEVSDQT